MIRKKLLQLSCSLLSASMLFSAKITGFVLLAMLLVSQAERVDADITIDSSVSEQHKNEPVRPLPIELKLDPVKVALGKRLFHDVRLSADNTISCASCHPLDRGGTDGKALSHGIGGAVGIINTPTVFNAGFNMVQFWNGRAATLEDQIEGPVNNPVEMGSIWPQVLFKLKQDSAYQKTFIELYPDGITVSALKNAIATFERSLITPDNPFDNYLRGDDKAISEAQKKGYILFKSYGCASCHQGRLLGGNFYERMGVVEDYFSVRDKPVTDADLGRFLVTGNEHDKHEFKVPSLRNIELTAPYFHDASATTLNQAVSMMARYQLGQQIPSSEIDLIVSFLRSLTGKLKEQTD